MSPYVSHNQDQPLILNSIPMNHVFGFSTDGGDEGNRTLDPLLAGQVLSQLSYTPVMGNNRFPSGKCQSKLVLIVGPWKSNNNFEFANRVYVVLFVSL